MKMNEHIELVKKYINDPDSVSQQQLEDNHEAACTAYEAADRAAYEAADWAAYRAADWATHMAAAGDVERAKNWVERYEELVK